MESLIGLAIILTTVTATSRRELERAAELAVERAAEKVAERAAEKSLEEGNSTTLTVTVKEGYSNARKTAEEQAAPGSESTRPGNPQGNYHHSPAFDEKYYDPYDVDKTTLFSPSSDDTENAGSWREYSMEGADGYADGENRDSGPADFDSDFEFDFDSNVDFDTKRSDDGLFRKTHNSKRSLKPRTRRDRGDFEDYDGEDRDENIFLKYKRLNPAWSTTSNDGWTRYRPLWDDDRSFGNGKNRRNPGRERESDSGEEEENKGRGSEESGEHEEEESERDEENEKEDEEEEETRERKRVRKRMSRGQERSRDEDFYENKFERALENFRKSRDGKTTTSRPSLQSYAKKPRTRVRESGQKEVIFFLFTFFFKLTHIVKKTC